MTLIKWILCLALSTLCISIKSQSYNWSSPDGDLPAASTNILLPGGCQEFLSKIPTEPELAKRENAWLGSIFYGVEWRLVDAIEDNDTIGMSLLLPMEDCRLKVNAYSWEGASSSKLDQFYNTFYQQIKERTKLIKSVIENGKITESDRLFYDDAFLDSLDLFSYFFKNQLNQEDIPNLPIEDFINAMGSDVDGGNPLAYVNYDFDFKRVNGVYYFHEDDLEKWLDALYIAMAKVNHYIDEYTQYGFNTKNALGIENLDCNVCCEFTNQGLNVRSGLGFLLSNFPSGEYNLSDNQKGILDRYITFIKNKNLDVIAIEGRASNKGNKKYSRQYIGNRNLSGLRALEVRKYLSSHGVRVDYDQVYCLGEEDPLTTQLPNGPYRHERSVSIFLSNWNPPSAEEVKAENEEIVTRLDSPRDIPNQLTTNWAISLDHDVSSDLHIGVGLGIVGIQGRLKNMDSGQVTPFIMAIPTIGLGVDIGFSCSNGGPVNDDNFYRFITSSKIDDPKYFEKVLIRYISFSLGAKIDILGLSLEASCLEFADGFATPQGIATFSHPTTLGISCGTGTAYMWVGGDIPDVKK